MSDHHDPESHRPPFEEALLAELLAAQQDLKAVPAGRRRMRRAAAHEPRRARTYGLTAAALLVVAAGTAVGTGLTMRPGAKNPQNSQSVAYLTSKAINHASKTQIEYTVTTTNSGGKEQRIAIWRYGPTLHSEVFTRGGVWVSNASVTVGRVGGSCNVSGTAVIRGASSKIKNMIKHATPSINTLATDVQKALADHQLKVVGHTTINGQAVIELKGTMRMGALPGLVPAAARAMRMALCYQQLTPMPFPGGVSGSSGSSGPSGPSGPSGSSGPSGPSGVIAETTGTVAAITGSSGPVGNSGPPGPSGSSGNSGATINWKGPRTQVVFSAPALLPLVHVTLYVNAKTYLPVRVTTSLPGAMWTTSSVFRWLPLVAPNIAELHVAAAKAALHAYKATVKAAKVKHS